MSIFVAFSTEKNFDLGETIKQIEFRGIDKIGLIIHDFFKNNLLISAEKPHITDVIKQFPLDLKYQTGFLYTKLESVNTSNNIDYYFDKSNNIFLLMQGEITNKAEILQRSNLAGFDLSNSRLIVDIINKHKQTSSFITVLNYLSKLLKGSYSIVVYDLNDYENIYALKNRSTLSIGKLNDGYVLSSDPKAFIKQAEAYFDLLDGNILIINKEKVRVLDRELKEFDFEFLKINKEYLDDSLKGFSHHMLKEIHEQKEIPTRLKEKYLNGNRIPDYIVSDLRLADKIYILAAGTSYHASLVGKKLLEIFGNIPVEVITASEFYYQSIYITNNPYFIIVSQSGETGDLIKCLEKLENYKILTITNSSLSTLAKRANYYLDVYSGREIAVCSTKAYSAQILLFFILANSLANNKLNLDYEFDLLSDAIINFIDNENIIEIARKHIIKRNIFYLGRGLDYYVSLEGALKLKEISKIQAEGYPAGEFRHGPIAMIEEETPVVALISDINTSIKMRENIEELRARGASVLVISLRHLSVEGDEIILDDVHPLLTPMITVIPLQLIAYYAALLRGLNIDKPKNLTKSVTVE